MTHRPLHGNTYTGHDYDGPVTPYPEPGGEAETSGWSGSATSHARALREDADGITSRRQQRVMQLLRRTSWKPGSSVAVGGTSGLTVKDVRDLTDWHHGQASSALSVLHKNGTIARLTARRDRCAVYVLPEYVNGRETAAVGRTAATPAPPTLTIAEKIALGNAKGDHEAGFTPRRVDVQMLIATIERLTRG